MVYLSKKIYLGHLMCQQDFCYGTNDHYFWAGDEFYIVYYERVESAVVPIYLILCGNQRTFGNSI
jgi:hypothetical protein